MSKKWAVCTAFFILSMPQLSKANEISLEFDSLTYSEPYTIDGLINDLRGDLSSGNTAFTFNELKLSYQKNNWHIALLSRADYLLKFNADTAELFYQIENGVALDTDRKYLIDLQAEHIIAKGVQFGYQWQFDNDSWLSTDISLLKASKLMSGELYGSWQETSTEQLTDLSLDYHYSKDLLFKSPVSHATGTGIAIDVAGYWQYDENYSADFTIKDLFSQIHWSDASYTRVTANSISNVSIVNGQLDVKPILSGYTGEERYKQKLPQRWLVGVNYRQRKHSFRSEIFYVSGYVFPRLKYQYRPTLHVKYSTGYDFKSEALRLGLSYYGLDLNLATDSLSKKKAHSLTVTAALKLAF